MSVFVISGLHLDHGVPLNNLLALLPAHGQPVVQALPTGKGKRSNTRSSHDSLGSKLVPGAETDNTGDGV